MAERLKDKVIIVTGGNSGVGRAVAERVAAEGAVAVIGARRKDVGEQVAEDIRSSGGKSMFVRVDATVEAEVEALVRTTVDEFGRLDGAFNNAGGVNAYGPVSNIAGESWHAELAQNLTSVFYGLKYEIPALLASGGGAVLNHASNLGVVGMAEVAPYVAAKHAVVGLTRAVALEVAAAGVRVNALATGGVDTPLFRTTMGTTPEAVAHIERLHPVGRISRPEEVAAFAAFLLSDESAFVTGAALAIDGGFTAR
jgi:NAD(P)-dependent dehydrogenase (short-subunit alcohol dehydrogenase family)